MSRKSQSIEDILSLSPLQEGLIFHSVYDDETAGIYTLQLAFDVEGSVEPAALRAAAAAMLRRHAALRACFRQRKTGEWVQIVLKDIPVAWSEVDLSHLSPQEREHETARIMREDRARRFDLGKPPLIRFTLVRQDDDQHRLVIAAHHTVLDGWSLPVMLRELMALYVNGADEQALPLVRPYRDYLKWLAEQDREATEQAWREALVGLERPSLVAPLTDGRVPKAPGQLTFGLPAPQTAALERRARSLGVTVNSVVQAAWSLVLSSLLGRDDVVFGVVVSGRSPELTGVEDMVGLFINTVPLRLRLDPTETSGRLLTRLQAEQARLLDHQHLGRRTSRAW